MLQQDDIYPLEHNHRSARARIVFASTSGLCTKPSSLGRRADMRVTRRSSVQFPYSSSLRPPPGRQVRRRALISCCRAPAVFPGARTEAVRVNATLAPGCGPASAPRWRRSRTRTATRSNLSPSAVTVTPPMAATASAICLWVMSAMPPSTRALPPFAALEPALAERLERVQACTDRKLSRIVGEPDQGRREPRPPPPRCPGRPAPPPSARRAGSCSPGLTRPPQASPQDRSPWPAPPGTLL